MKILFLSRQLNIGGAERQLVTLANELAARGHEIVIASYYPGGALSEMIDPKRIKVISYEKKSRWDLFTLFFKTLKIVRDEQPTVLHGWMHTQNVVATVAKILNPKVTMVWAVRASNLRFTSTGPKSSPSGSRRGSRDLRRASPSTQWLGWNTLPKADCPAKK